MPHLVWVVVLLVVLGVLTALLKKSKGHAGPAGRLQPTEKTPFKTNKFFLTAAEQSFYGCLKQAVGGRLDIFAKTRLLDVLWLPPQAEGKQRWRNMAQSKHVDFLLCDPKTLLPALAIELDDSSHGRADRQVRDELVEKMLEDAGLPLMRIDTQAAYNVRALGEAIQERMVGKTQAAAIG